MYAYVSGGEIVNSFGAMPEAFGNVSHPAGLSAEEQRAIGLYEVIDNPPALRPYERAEQRLEFNAGAQTVTAVYTVVGPSLEHLRAILWAAIKTKRQAVLEGGVQAAGRWFHSDLFSRTQWLALLVQGQSLPAGIQWKCMDNTFVELTPTLVLQVAGAMMAKEQTAFIWAETLKAQVNAAADPYSIDLDAGWPASYV
jgi:hypothetical protein